MPDREQTRSVHPVLWGVYLAVSWTWCIGMFLPVLLLRDYGVWGYVAFAAPNVVGAAAMGWTLRSGRVSEGLVRLHARAMGLFSAVTIAFHLFFMLWLMSLVRDLPGVAIPDWGLVALPIAGLGAIVGVRRATRRGDAPTTLVALVTWVASGVVLASLALSGEPSPGASALLPETARTPGLLWLAPVCLFGFALCPYLDLTFHHARQRTSAGGARVAFTLGFGAFFFAMILLTLAYSGLFGWVLGGEVPAPRVAGWALVAVLGHTLLQLIFTVIVHQDRVRRAPGGAGARATLALGAGAIVLGLLHERLPEVGGMTGGEVVYRCFMAFYGLVFPAYVWLVMIPTRDGHAGLGGDRGRWKGLVFAFVTAMAAPMFWMGFVGGHELYLAPGLALVLGSRIAVSRRGQGSEASTSEAV
ncbi:MAG: hypothetical protein ACIARR_12815 [Phycisphaerales bacterium JB059]